ncbi:MAG: hypothetical protein JRN26_02320 [Nitrososphaerota archaeon]|jgi:hypothetical protein|nr:hypothetical protein [Nitrososphaerota archaeon]MDG6930275.1 hypothetical protein [Nitrososphaerota archaeon]MDG6932980.1 hypothetical protein [Nitrososphaerota archaeon]MDG6935712.1 hypothetical protein [Nitrososphaerota archaeon]MDG6943550.1 hypothetical protein [Nitrososphaerota archaeon]
MDTASVLNSMLADPARKVVVSTSPVDLLSCSYNELYIFIITESGSPAGGRAAGFGGRTIARVYRFACKEGKWSMELDTDSETILSKIDIPAGIARLPVTLLDGSELLAYAVIDGDAVREISMEISGAGLTGKANTPNDDYGEL